MNSDEYQVTIKSANQKVDDYVTSCKSSWTVQRLKQHISETHVNQPNIEDQRLIYAGNLLKDTQTLKQIFFRDSLCTELTNASKTDFTIHLVCSLSSQKGLVLAQPQRTHQLTSNSSSQTARHNESSQASSSTASTSPHSTTPSANTSNSLSTNLQSNTNNHSVSSVNISTNHQSVYTFDTNHAIEIARNLMQSNQMRQQLAVFQQLANIVAAQIAQNIIVTNGADFDGYHHMPDDLSQQQYQAPNMINTSLTPNFLPLMNFQAGANDHTSAAAIASNIAGLQLSVDGTVSQTTSRAANTEQTNDPFVATTNSQDSRGAGVTLNNNVANQGTAANVDNNQNMNQHNRDNLVGPQQVAGDNANMGQFNFNAQRQMAQAQPIVEQPGPVAAAQVGDPEAQIMQHDVIDWVYYSIRAAILMMALYIHASLFRLSFLAGLLALAYYFSRRSARRATVQQQQQQQQQPQPPQPLRQRAQIQEPRDRPPEGLNLGAYEAADAANVVRNGAPARVDAILRRRNVGLVNGDEQNNGNVSDNEDGNQRDQQAAEVEVHRRVPLLKLCYLVVTDFLASLVPE